MSKYLPFTHDNHLTLLYLGQEYFTALIDAIDNATREVALETYIFEADDAGQNVSAALQRAAQRGVAVRVITDGIGTSRRLAYFNDWREAGVMHRIYNPHLFGRFGFSRTHRKLAVIDHAVAFVGGINIIDDYNGGGGVRMDDPRWDFAVQCRGPIVAEIAIAFHIQWLRLAPGYLGTPFRHRHHGLRGRLHAPYAGQAAFVARDNLHNRRAVEKAYLMALGRARHEVWLANPYFVPGRRLRRALTQAARRGVAVHLLIGRKEFRLLDTAVPWLYAKLLDAGVRIGEYDMRQLHGKVAVVDDVWATVGSSNLDALSLFLNHEANVVVLDDPVVIQLRDHIRRAFADARLIDPARYGERSRWRRFHQWLAYRLYRLAMKVLTRWKYD
ncbi:cardiolipin synthase ClsB [Pandoraea nosoerga]|uniref:Cardiolipin synthase B n=1 Tax=Pandoraea nosoerga TaxID=2508296 RepID=A0A5E4R9G9_9BURK|nr:MULTISPECIES: cardiolipin synthase ClsB [Pandoraea]MBN4666677.1 cardiolipin synthase ClsB [Pandoraea nosoerga]MBN4676827.1 cardiolipin synthase ClsB [Pandoraea nosoerga]MBN4681567.1 cardiolipin synthase ClsB [Pandoraea nosoerga]MBN4745946.1 cardiolipin synthase ClsB [Pandoraea nosoerga]VVD59835.1 cardiolipin synthetase [Pandoraea nosoerga]